MIKTAFFEYVGDNSFEETLKAALKEVNSLIRDEHINEETDIIEYHTDKNITEETTDIPYNSIARYYHVSVTISWISRFPYRDMELPEL